ncbi:MAG: exosome complex RNA-binding protein Csl4 [Candidatus Diapherotrites archaeon]
MTKKLVLPGEELGTSEEFEAGENTFQEDGLVCADCIGEAEFDQKNYQVKVKKAKPLKAFTPGTRVYGIVSAVRKNYALITMREAYAGKEKRVLTRGNATLMVSMIANSYIKDIRDAFRVGDIIVAEVESIKPYGVNLRTNKPDLGVVRAYCSKCRKPLHLTQGKLMCTGCGSLEKRKTASEYILK